MRNINITIEQEPLIKWGWVRALLFLGGCTLAMIVYRELRDILFQDRGLSELEFTFFRHFLKCLTFVFVAYIMRIFVDRKSFISLGYSFAPKFRKDFLIGLALGVGMISIMFTILIITESISITSIQFPVYSLLLLFGILSVAVIREEIVSRGYILNNLMSSMNKYIALLITSIFFMLLHAGNSSMTIFSYVNIVLAGIMIGVYYIHQKNLWLPMGLHFGWNFALGGIFGSAVSGNNLPSIISIELTGNDLLTGGAFGFEASILTPILIIIATIFIHYKYKI